MATTRQCGTCTLCCKVMTIKELNKPTGQWCSHCSVGAGCQIHASKPQACTDFECGWLTDETLGPEWKPEKSKFVLIRRRPNRLLVHVDPAMPDAWKRPPYHKALMATMESFLRDKGQVFIVVRDQFTLLLPDGEHRIGALSKDLEITVTRNPDNSYNVVAGKGSG
jgi:hypothetical protein